MTHGSNENDNTILEIDFITIVHMPNNRHLQGEFITITERNHI